MEFKNLGNESNYTFEYDKSKLEKFENEFKGNDYLVSMEGFEFTTCCPITAQPDFATIFINYIPDKYLVESKSLKLYFTSFRNQGTFHEDCINTILNDLVELLDPKYIEVLGMFNSRGGIAIRPFASFAREGFGYEQYKIERQFQILNNIKS